MSLLVLDQWRSSFPNVHLFIVCHVMITELCTFESDSLSSFFVPTFVPIPNPRFYGVFCMIFRSSKRLFLYSKIYFLWLYLIWIKIFLVCFCDILYRTFISLRHSLFWLSRNFYFLPNMVVWGSAFVDPELRKKCFLLLTLTVLLWLPNFGRHFQLTTTIGFFTFIR